MAENSYNPSNKGTWFISLTGNFAIYKLNDNIVAFFYLKN